MFRLCSVFAILTRRRLSALFVCSLWRTGSTAGLRYSTKRTSVGAMHRVPSTLQDPSQPSLPCTTAWCVQRLGKSGITVGAQCKTMHDYLPPVQPPLVTAARGAQGAAAGPTATATAGPTAGATAGATAGSSLWGFPSRAGVTGSMDDVAWAVSFAPPTSKPLDTRYEVALQGTLTCRRVIILVTCGGMYSIQC